MKGNRLGSLAREKGREDDCVRRLVLSRSSKQLLWIHSRKSQGPFHVPIVPMNVNSPVAGSMLYIETLFESEFVT